MNEIAEIEMIPAKIDEKIKTKPSTRNLEI
jgi:hypothetical protein